MEAGTHRRRDVLVLWLAVDQQLEVLGRQVSAVLIVGELHNGQGGGAALVVIFVIVVITIVVAVVVSVFVCGVVAVVVCRVLACGRV